MYFPWGGKVRVGPGKAQLEARSGLGQAMPPTTFLRRLSRASAICVATRSVPDTRKALEARRVLPLSTELTSWPQCQYPGSRPLLSVSQPISSVYELSRTLSPSLEPRSPSLCSALWVQQAISWLALTSLHLSQEPVPNPILSSRATSYLILLHLSVSLLSQPPALKKSVHCSCYPSLHSHARCSHMCTQQPQAGRHRE